MMFVKRQALGWAGGVFLLLAGLGGIAQSPDPDLEATLPPLLSPVPPSILLEDFFVPALDLPELVQARPVSTAVLRQGPTVVAFVGPDCSACELLLNTMAALSVRLPPEPDKPSAAVVPFVVTYAVIRAQADEAFGAWVQRTLAAPLPEGSTRDPFYVFLDDQRVLIDLFRVHRAPTLFFLAEGRPLQRWDAPSLAELIDGAFAAWVQARLAETVSSSPLSVRLGQAAPAFSATTWTGDAVELPPIGQTTLLSFVSVVTCSPSRKLITDLTTLSLRFPQLRFYLVALEDPQTFQAYTSGEGLSLSTLMDPEFQIAQLYGIPGTPTSLLVDGKGVIRWIQVGWHERLFSVLETLLTQAMN